MLFYMSVMCAALEYSTCRAATGFRGHEMELRSNSVLWKSPYPSVLLSFNGNQLKAMKFNPMLTLITWNMMFA